MYQLYYYPLNASMAPRFVLEKIDAEYQLVLVDRESSEQKSAGYLALNPLGRIPTLVDGDLVLCESPAICIYLAEKHAESNLMANASSPERAMLYQWMIYLTNTFQAELMVYFYPQRYLSEQGCIDDLMKSVEARLIEVLALIDSQLKKHEFLAGDALTVCDYFLFMLCVWADELKKPPLAFTSLSRHLKKIASLAEVRNVCRHENLCLSAYK